MWFFFKFERRNYFSILLVALTLTVLLNLSLNVHWSLLQTDTHIDLSCRIFHVLIQLIFICARIRFQ